VTHDEYQDGIHYYLAEADLLENHYEEPFVHFDCFEAPPFLFPAVRQYLGLTIDSHPVAQQFQENR
jgi:hypothetical protein